ncbi:helix-turn-helix domain-containing protein [Curvivirga sp.]|uniref:helix-turn-helix domain-containing protein n=1 Tax=Curvivirga sp. TaxID=2856848 RepID=UPI003B5BB751
MSEENEIPKIGRKVLRLRQAYKMSLDDLANKSGVSKSVLSQIERDQNNPTLSTIHRICVALNVTVEELLRKEASPRVFDVVADNATPVIHSEDGKCSLRILGPIHTVNWLQWYHVTVEPGGRLFSEAHDLGTLENVTVLDGCLKIETGEDSHLVYAGETIRYPADKDHVVINDSDIVATGLMVVVLGRPM